MGAAGCREGGVCWFPLCHLKVREARGCADQADGGEPKGSRFAGAEQGLWQVVLQPAKGVARPWGGVVMKTEGVGSQKL